VRHITRFDTSTMAAQIAGEVPDFDELAWVKPKDRPHVSRVVPLARCATAEAFADAGLDPAAMTLEQLREIGVLVGSGGGSQEFTEEQYRKWYNGEWRDCSVYTIPTSTIGTMASEVSMHFGLRGLSHVVSTGCTSSTDAIGYAAQHIRTGMLDIAVAGGADAPLAPLIQRGFLVMRIMSTRWNEEPQRASRPFSRDRDGFVIAEGAWFFILEERERALQRGARIYGEIAGYGSTCEAFHRVRLEESGEEPARTIQIALRTAGLDTGAVDYVNYHGTSTELNDRIETKAMHIAFGDRAAKVPGSAIKSLIGHPQGACGAAGLAATLLGMRDGVVHGTRNLEVPDPECDLDYVSEAPERKLAVETAVCNCIAFGSKNSALVVRRPDAR